ncbi:carboxypeptidase-like regulatory domain-containing protein [Aureibaculum sp. A20]|uniref:Carboxypeptidase-like regulatory domain-containing protein n=1 Tax=Aureibaculum flavum TaxID=2795986 RepID=A0ABS0WP85_9FLAO|nr:carboxypeptidase-like regulatory domain-containing protein [Aureibaculum flavum]MBJ2173803.1 carboxypeptidase-like regulatory domain-containing protein [Aureibaculum flavum]
MKFTTSIILLISTMSLLAQNFAEGIIKDIETNEPIPYVNIGIINKSIGTVTNFEGKFQFETQSNISNDTIRLSSIGYKSESMIFRDFLKMLKTNSEVLLIPDVTALNEVVITAKKLKEKVIGNKSKSKRIRLGFTEITLGQEIGTKIRINNSPTYIKSFHTNIAANSNDTLKYRINFYSIKDGLPYEKIVNQNIIFPIDVKEGEFTLNLEAYNIIVKDDIYCTLELIEVPNPEDELFFSAAFLGNKMIIRSVSQGDWEKVGAVGVGFNCTVKY